MLATLPSHGLIPGDVKYGYVRRCNHAYDISGVVEIPAFQPNRNLNADRVLKEVYCDREAYCQESGLNRQPKSRHRGVGDCWHCVVSRFTMIL